MTSYRAAMSRDHDDVDFPAGGPAAVATRCTFGKLEIPPHRCVPVRIQALIATACAAAATSNGKRFSAARRSLLRAAGAPSLQSIRIAIDTDIKASARTPVRT